MKAKNSEKKHVAQKVKNLEKSQLVSLIEIIVENASQKMRKLISETIDHKLSVKEEVSNAELQKPPKEEECNRLLPANEECNETANSLLVDSKSKSQENSDGADQSHYTSGKSDVLDAELQSVAESPKKEESYGFLPATEEYDEIPNLVDVDPANEECTETANSLLVDSKSKSQENSDGADQSLNDFGKCAPLQEFQLHDGLSSDEETTESFLANYKSKSQEILQGYNTSGKADSSDAELQSKAESPKEEDCNSLLPANEEYKDTATSLLVDTNSKNRDHSEGANHSHDTFGKKIVHYEPRQEDHLHEFDNHYEDEYSQLDDSESCDMSRTSKSCDNLKANSSQKAIFGDSESDLMPKSPLKKSKSMSFDKSKVLFTKKMVLSDSEPDFMPKLALKNSKSMSFDKSKVFSTQKMILSDSESDLMPKHSLKNSKSMSFVKSKVYSPQEMKFMNATEMNMIFMEAAKKSPDTKSLNGTNYASSSFEKKESPRQTNIPLKGAEKKSPDTKSVNGTTYTSRSLEKKSSNSQNSESEDKKLETFIDRALKIKAQQGSDCPIPGLTNFGNVCYFNALIQCFHACHLQLKFKLNADNPIHDCLLKLSDQKGVLKTAQWTKKLAAMTSGKFFNNQFHDAADFFSKTAKLWALNDYHCFQQVTAIECQNCLSNDFYRNVNLDILVLPKRKTKLIDSINEHFSTQLRHRSPCKKCASEDVYRVMSYKLNDVLIISFSGTFGSTFDINKSIKIMDCEYLPIGFVNFYPAKKHYTATVRMVDGKWWSCDDISITHLSEPTIEAVSLLFLVKKVKMNLC